MADMSASAFSGATPSLASTFAKFSSDPTGSAMTMASKILDQASTPFGTDMTQLRQGLTALAAQNPELADAVRGLTTTSLSPLQAGELLSGRTYGAAPQALGTDAANAAKLAAREPSTSSDYAIPSSASAAPKTITFTPAMQVIFEAQWQQSFPNGKSQEQGSTIIFDRNTGEVSVTNFVGGTSGSVLPSLDVSHLSNTGVLGAFHTHPYDASEQGHTSVSLSGGDAAWMINNKLNVFVAQSGTTQFMFMRTDKTPSRVDFNKLNDTQNARILDLVAKGFAFNRASRIAALETANRYGLAYYEGSNGTLRRTN